MTERIRVCHPAGGPVLVKRAEQDSTDVNLIMDSWIHAGAAVAGHMNQKAGQYGDFSSGVDYHAALSAVREAEGLFMCLAPKIRNHVENDPGKLLDLVYDPERREELVELGLVAPRAPVVGAAEGEAGAGAVDTAAESTGADDAGDVPLGGQETADPQGNLFD